MTHSAVTETNEFTFTDVDYRNFRDANTYSQIPCLIGWIF